MNSLFFVIGPPNEPPNMLYLLGGTPAGANGFCDCPKPVRRNPNPSPCQELLPLLVWIVTTPAVACPNSALYPWVVIFISPTESTVGLITTIPSSGSRFSVPSN